MRYLKPRKFWDKVEYWLEMTALGKVVAGVLLFACMYGSMILIYCLAD